MRHQLLAFHCAALYFKHGGEGFTVDAVENVSEVIMERWR